MLSSPIIKAISVELHLKGLIITGCNSAISSTQGMLSVEKCQFINNTKAIIVEQTSTIITSSSFIQSGGPPLSGSFFTSEVISSNFTNNNSPIRFIGILSFHDCIFRGNIGGAIELDSDFQTTLTRCYFFNNSAPSGGAIASWPTIFPSSTLRIINCTFENNKADSCGAATIFNNNNVELTKSVFINNTSPGVGGALCYRASGSRDAIINNCTFIGNSGSDGGAVYNDYSNIVFNYCNFNGNKATTRGGAFIGLFEARFVFNHSTFFFNNATNGGAVAVAIGTTLIMESITLDSNKASDNGGALLIEGSGTATLKMSTVNNNKSGRNGGAMYANDSPIKVYDSTFSNNRAENSGGALFLPYGSEIKDSRYISIFLFSIYFTILLLIVINFLFLSFILPLLLFINVNQRFLYNSANASGGATVIGTGTVTNCFFFNNTAQRGGASFSTNANFSSSLFQNNTATVDGASIADSGKTIINNCTFSFGKTIYGGGVVSRGTKVEIFDSKFIGNIAEGYGGGIGLNSESGSLKILGCVFDSNYGGEGGAIRVNGSPRI